MNPIPYRIRLGVTGHRSLKDKDILSERITEILKNDLLDEKSKELVSSFASTTPLSFSILTPLAEGADRLVAETVLAFNKTSSIEVVLPMTLNDYKKTFSDPDNPQFDELRSKAREVIALRNYDFTSDPKIVYSNSPDDIESKIERARKEAYERVGHYVVNHVDILIALWDGNKSAKQGGTSETVSYANSKGLPLIILSTEAPYKINPVKRFEIYEDSIKSLDKFNKTELPGDYEEKIVNKSYSRLKAGAVESTQQDINYIDPWTLIKNIILPYSARSSLEAKKNQKRYKWGGFWIYMNSAFAIISAIIGILYPSVQFLSFSIEILSLLFVLGIFFYITKTKAHKNWLEYRFLTERLRSACFFLITNLEISAIEVPPHMRLAHKTNDWMIKVFNEIWNMLPPMKGLPENLLSWAQKYIDETWIQDQIGFHKKKRNNLRRLNKWIAFTGWLFFISALIVPIVHVCSSLITGENQGGQFNNLLNFLAIVLPVVSVAMVGIRTHREYERIERRSENMAIVLHDISHKFMTIENTAEFERLMHYTDEVTLRENQDWLMLMRLAKIDIL